MRRLPTLLVSVVAIAALACSGQNPAGDDGIEDGEVVDEDKEDNFLSLSAREFVVEGKSTVTMAPGATMAEVRKVISLKHISIAWFLNQYLVDKEHHDKNHSYGGFSAMVKLGSYEDLAITKKSDTLYEFKFAQIIAGKENLMDRAPFASGRFDVEIGKPSNEEMALLETNAEWYRKAPWDAWNPANVAPELKETLSLAIKQEPRPADAWWDFDKLFADGKLDIDVFMGWDYHSAYHVKHSKALYNWLTRDNGFVSPSKSFDAYTRTSGPLVKTIIADGKVVEVQIRIIYGKIGTDTDPDTDAGGRVLEDEVRDSVKKRDVIVYSGHSGPFYGFALANWKMTDEGDFDDADMLVAEMATKYQIVVAEGCDTYQIGGAFLGNPNKMGKNVDVITTTSFSNAESPEAVQLFISRLIETDPQGRHRPRTIKKLLTDLDGASEWAGFETYYGVHGIDDDPKIHPYASGMSCDECSQSSDCGGPGNACIKIGNSGKRCATACTATSGCGNDYACKKVASGNAIYGSMCVPKDNNCR